MRVAFREEPWDGGVFVIRADSLKRMLEARS